MVIPHHDPRASAGLNEPPAIRAGGNSRNGSAVAHRQCAEQGLAVPDGIFDAQHTADGGWLMRLGSSECLLEDGPPVPAGEGSLVSRLESLLKRPVPGVYRFPREDAVFIISGPGVHEVFAQTCGIDFRTATPQRVIFSRVAGVSCGILLETPDRRTYRIWCDPSYATYLDETLSSIAHQPAN